MARIPYHLYFVRSEGGRLGFGRATDYVDRNQHYATHSGEILEFPIIFEGWKSHVISLENKIKTRLSDIIWRVEKAKGDTWKTEWLKKGYDEKFLEDFVTEIIENEHLKIKLLTRKFKFTESE